MGSDTATIMEGLWVAVGLTGGTLASLNLALARKDRQAILAADGTIAPKRKAQLLMTARAAIRKETLRIAFHSVVVAIGLYGLSQHTEVVSSTRVAITAGYFLLSAITVAQSYLDRRDRRALIALELNG